MLPRLRPGDVLVVRGGSRVRPGDLVVVEARRGAPMVKRVTRRAPDGWWVQGDDPDLSTDSRTFGAVPEAQVRGRVVARLWPRPRRF